MNHTTDNMKEIAGTIARKITEEGQQIGVRECYVDDFGRFGNFQLVCKLNVDKGHGIRRAYRPIDNRKFSLVKIAWLIKRIIKEHKSDGAILRSHEAPQGVYQTSRYAKAFFEGYEQNYVMIDVDFIEYHAATNTFAVQEFRGTDKAEILPGQLSLNL